MPNVVYFFLKKFNWDSKVLENEILLHKMEFKYLSIIFRVERIKQLSI